MDQLGLQMSDFRHQPFIPEIEEAILWHGNPEPMAMLRGYLPHGIVGVLWVTITIGVMTSSVSVNPWNLIAVGLLAAPGVWLALKPWRAYHAAPRTKYWLTSRRAVIELAGFPRTNRSRWDYTLDRLSDRELTLRAGGSGSIVFETIVHSSTDGGSRVQHIGFMRIGNPQEVDAIITDAVDAFE